MSVPLKSLPRQGAVVAIEKVPSGAFILRWWNSVRLKPVSALDHLPSSKQVAFAEKLARIKRRAVPDECFRDKGLMSKWIDGNR